MQALLGHTRETRRLRHALAHLPGTVPNLQQQSGYTKRLRKLAPTMAWLDGGLGRATAAACDDVRVVTPPRPPWN